MERIDFENKDIVKAMSEAQEHRIDNLANHDEAITNQIEHGRILNGLKLPWAATHFDVAMPLGTCSVLAGINSHKKSTLSVQIMLWITQHHDYKVGLASFEMTIADIGELMSQMAAGATDTTVEHWQKFKEHMFMAKGDDEKVLALKPMNCPGHVQIYKQGLKSYKDLPIRMAEFGSCHRNEPSGALHGIMRVRQFTQDDAHIFCMDSQITSESVEFCELLQKIYKDFGFSDLKVKFSDRPEIRAGDDETWDKAEKALIVAINAAGISYSLNPGEGAFYGPKLEFVLTDAIGRDWQCGTLQVDFVLPKRLGANYIDTDGQKKHPVMLHRAILGSLERWIGIIIEQYSGRMPLWLAPTQVIICSIIDSTNDYVLEIKNKLDRVSIRSEVDLRNEKIGYKIREHSNSAIPIIIVIGNKEKENKSVAVRYLGSKNQEILYLDQFIKNIESKCLPPDLI